VVETEEAEADEQEREKREERQSEKTESSELVEVTPKRPAKSETKEPIERTDDPVRIYLREMGSIGLLSRHGEVAIAKRIEAARETITAGLCESPLTFQATVAAVRKRVETREEIPHVSKRTDSKGRFRPRFVGFIAVNISNYPVEKGSFGKAWTS
jgi:hypothetical protein